ncbi:MAG: bifunctional adenosylcobinamide kinase/adenosylcobinamide-phosphate guanylyltransferase [Treponema sp.]|nr:bifunctional adenosylcobinamide kinase/adenosylcobinamide-phosphate guanylyltransferase [Treponema sp.]
MTVLVSGGCKNGKSSYAQERACTLAKNAPLVYFATMIPHDSEDEERIKKHREDRKNLGFETIECGKNICEAVKKLKPNSVVLFDSLTALIANELFDSSDSMVHAQQDEEKITQKIQSDLEFLMNHAQSVVFVSDTIFFDGKNYDKFTELYRRILAKTENFLADKCDTVVEMVAGSRSEQLAVSSVQLVVGGAYQGKTAWAKKEFSLSDDDVCVCSGDSLPDFSKRCISHYENYVAYCLKHSHSPKTDFSRTSVEVIICDDIFCGVVPIDYFQRQLREQTGLALQKIAKNAELTRIFCGIPQKISPNTNEHEKQK